MIITCHVCGEEVEGLLDYENHARAHEREPREQLARARARSRANKEGTHA